MVIKGKVKSDSVEERRPRLLTDIKVNLALAQYNLADDSHQRFGFEKMQMIKLAIKREITMGHNGGFS